ncbi:MAG: hypothetical protein JNM12_07920 [Alphaproteobacteria bacterium]|nr:hypothetical protein [Alphaproteobacteria bacterium]
MKLAAIFTSIILLGLWALYVSGLPKMTGPGMAVTSEMMTVSLSLPNGIRLNIPKAYLVKVDNWRGGEQNYINIDADVSDMKPIDAARQYAPDEIIQIRLKSMSSKEFDNWIAKVQTLSLYFEPSQYGLMKVKEDYFKKENIDFPGSYPPREDVYYSRMQGRFVKVSCRTVPLEVNCVVDTNFGLVKASYIIGRNHIPKSWQAIDSKVEKLMTTFIQDR